MEFIITNQIGHKTVIRTFLNGERADSYINKVCKHNSFTTATTTKITNHQIYITIWDTMY